MSIIFQKLKALTSRSSAPDNNDQENRLNKSQNVYTFRKMIFSPRGAMLIIATIAGFSMISYYGLSFLKGHLDDSSNKAIIIQQSQQTDMDQDDEIDPETGLPYDPETYAENNPDAPLPKPIIKFKVPDFFLDKTKTKPDADADLDIPQAPGKKIVLEHLPPLPVAISQPSKKTTKKDQHLSQLTDKEKPPPKPYDSKKSTTASLEDAPLKDTDQKLLARQNLRHMMKNKKNKEVSKMVTLSTELENAVLRNDTARIDQLLEELFKGKTPSQPYILKLMAYKQIQQKNYENAKRYLQSILLKDKTDFEAGINMAIIEIRQQQIPLAKKRLIELREWYPSQVIIDNLLNQL